MIKKIRKYILPNMPYILAFWFCLKLSTAYRLANGDFLNIPTTLNQALQTIAPGTNPQDWLIGIAGAVILRAIIYYKVKNAKKYRKDIEYGSARWSA